MNRNFESAYPNFDYIYFVTYYNFRQNNFLHVTLCVLRVLWMIQIQYVASDYVYIHFNLELRQNVCLYLFDKSTFFAIQLFYSYILLYYYLVIKSANKRRKYNFKIFKYYNITLISCLIRIKYILKIIKLYVTLLHKVKKKKYINTESII